MYNHAPKDYKCPICLGVNGIENEDTLLKQSDLVYSDELVSVFINSFWIKTCEGHAIVVPNKHYENIYELPNEVANQIMKVSKKLALAMKKAYKCDGLTIKQLNEPAGGQHAFHYHMHIVPRYNRDNYIKNLAKKSILSNPADRIKYKNKLTKYL